MGNYCGQFFIDILTEGRKQWLGHSKPLILEGEVQGRLHAP
jgi:hypothetical protein